LFIIRPGSFPPTGERQERVFSLEELSDRSRVRSAVSRFAARMMNVVAVLAVCGVVVSTVSLQHHFAKSKTAYCDIGEAFNCDIVNRSEYSSILVSRWL